MEERWLTVVHGLILSGAWDVEDFCEERREAGELVPVGAVPVENVSVNVPESTEVVQNGGDPCFVERVDELVLGVSKDHDGVMCEAGALGGEEGGSREETKF